MRIKIFLVNVLLLASFFAYSQNNKTDSILSVLKAELKKEKAYDLKKEVKINQLRNHLLHTKNANFETQYYLLSQIFEEYRSFRFDSAFTYVKRMITASEQFGKKDFQTSSQILMGSILLNSGYYKEAFDAVKKVDTTNLTDKLKTDYFNLRARLYIGAAEYNNDAYFSKIYYKQSELDFKNAELATPISDFEKTINLAFLPASKKNKNLTPDFFYNFIVGQRLPEHGIAMVATRVSYAYTGEDRILFLALAAINDIRSSTKETLAIFLLGQELFKLNRTNDAYILMQQAIKNAKFYGTRNRAIQIESILPLIASKLIDEKQHEKDKILIGFLVFVIVAVVLFFLLIIYRKQILHIKANERTIKEKNSELEKVNGKLWESSRIKEGLIGLFFKTCSTYIETLDRVTRKTQHNIKLGKYNEASAILNDVQIGKEKDRFYDTLDKVFLTIFPNFILSFNALLKKEDQVWPKKGEALNATLRIFALIRLGVTDSETIAKILNYSVSTVYTYKVRVKSKALVPADDFEHKIMEIKFIDDL
ncbi:DUF6377 domain-containing protein [Mucilaginibacter lacusdianchii]|uniref:DUF6377 domain-containing protein n=1 Tax=Mucilaginibacter lacusdianchii TaxID=2684211 RepID=UPI00131BF0F7|nr:DUF6377 domain-containing protein [Mucilaginibacter sp. JXJ CY 39]